MRSLVVLAMFGMISQDAMPAEPLGRLFYTPQQRAQLDLARSQRSRAALSSENAEAQPAPEVLTVSGAVRRSDGKATIWINNKPVAEGDRRGAVSIAGKNADGSVTLQTSQTERGVNLKVGQSVDVLSGRIEEPYQRQITVAKPEVKPPAPPADGAAAAKKPDAEVAARRKRDEEDERVAAARARAQAEAALTGSPPATAEPARRGN